MMRSFRHLGIGRLGLALTALWAVSCVADTTPSPEGDVTREEALVSLPNPILFVTQVPVASFASVSMAFANHTPSTKQVPRGGDLYIVYPDGTLRNLTKEAGFGVNGLQGASAIAVRQPSVHWSGQKALFSMLVGGASQFHESTAHWQIYEVSGLAEGQTAVIHIVPNQPSGYNNISPIYGTDDHVIFTSDQPRNGAAALYPQLDEYESTPTVTGLWSLDPVSGSVAPLTHDPSGSFSPFVDSAGRVVFTHWDHLQRDQQADADRLNSGSYGSFNYADESGANNPTTSRAEVFPEPRTGTDPLLPANTSPHTFNLFFPWVINEDGSAMETVNHVGNHEFGGAYEPGSFTNDPNLSYYTPQQDHLNTRYVRGDGGLFHLVEDPTQPGTFYAAEAEEFATDTAGAILSFTGSQTLDAEHMVITSVTDPVARTATSTAGAAGHPGHFRDPLPLSDGSLVASHTAETRADNNDGTATSPKYRYDFRLKKLVKQGSYWVAGPTLTSGITKSLTYYDPDQVVTVTGNLWELDPVEVRARTRPARRVEVLPAPEKSVLQQKGVDETALRAWLTSHNLAILVTRNVTTRDRADVQQPYNLRVPGGAQTIGKSGKIYDVSYLQFFQGDQIRGYKNRPGRRVLAQPLHDPAVHNPPITGPAGAVQLASDGSMAAFVPARRAMTWQLTDAASNPVVRERNWVSFAPGEIRACPSCHGVNTVDQAGHVAPTNPPAALGALLDYWKTINTP
jgi:hypothetical protein